MSWDKSDRKIREKLEKHASEVNPDQVWASIRSDIPSSSSSQKKAGAFWQRFRFFALLLLGLSSLGIWFLMENPSSPKQKNISDSYAPTEQPAILKDEKGRSKPKSNSENLAQPQNAFINPKDEKSQNPKESSTLLARSSEPKDSSKWGNPLSETASKNTPEASLIPLPLRPSSGKSDLSLLSEDSLNPPKARFTFLDSMRRNTSGNTILSDKLLPLEKEILSNNPEDSSILSKSAKPTKVEREKVMPSSILRENTGLKKTFTSSPNEDVVLSSLEDSLNRAKAVHSPQDRVPKPSSLLGINNDLNPSVPPSKKGDPLFRSLSLNSLKSLSFHLSPISRPDSLQISIISEYPNPERKLKGRWNLLFESGIGYSKALLKLREGANEEYLSLRNNSERSLETQLYSLQLGYQSPQGWSFRSGLNWSQITEVFEFNNTRVEEVPVEGVAYRRQNLNGNFDNIIGELILIRTTKIEKRIYNRYQLLELPLLLGYQKSLGKWKLGLELGPFLNLGFRAQGQILDPQLNFSTLSNSESPLLKSKIGLSYYGGLEIEKAFSPRFSWVLHPFIRYFPSDFSSDINPISQKYFMFGLQGGIKLKLSK